MKQEAVFAKAKTYATAQQVEKLRHVLAQAEQNFQQRKVIHNVTYAYPMDVAEILVDWQVPLTLIETAVWSVVPTLENRTNFTSILGSEFGKIAHSLSKFYHFLNETRNTKDDVYSMKDESLLHPTLFREFLSPGFVVLLTALFLATIRRGANSTDVQDKKILMLQSRTLFEPVVSERLGLWLVRRELRDLAFQCDEPDAYKVAYDQLQSAQGLQSFIDKVKWQVEKTARECGIECVTVKHELAYPYKIHKLLLQKEHLSPSDFVSFVILLPDEEACYRFIHPLHQIGEPGKSFRDYKGKNGYRSLHSRVPVNMSNPVKFFIRTLEWDERNNYGILYNWQQRNERLFRVEELLPKAPVGTLFVYKHDGKECMLPQNATVMTLAKKIHKQVGQACKGGYIYGRGYVQTTDMLEDGDIVKLLLKHAHISVPPGGSSSGRMYKSTTTITEVGQQKEKEEKNNVGSTAWRTDITKAVVVPPELSSLPCHVCDRCKPYPPNAIMAYLTVDNTLTIHRVDCKATQENSQKVRADWRLNLLPLGSTVMTVEAWDGIGLLHEITSSISKDEVNIASLHFETSSSTSFCKISVQESDHHLLESIRHRILQIPRVTNVEISMPEQTFTSAPYASKSLSKLRNPYSPKPASQTLFYGRRKEIDEIWRAIEGQGEENSNSVFLWGQQRIGKTSLLKHLEQDANSTGNPSLFIPILLTMMDRSPGEDHIQFDLAHGDIIRWFAQRVEQHLSFQVPGLANMLAHPSENKYWTFSEDILTDYFQQIQDVLTRGGSRRLIVMIDEFQHVHSLPDNQKRSFINCLSQIISLRKNISFIFSGWGFFPMKETDNLLYPLSSLARQIRLSVLDRKDAEALIRKPVPYKYDNTVVEQILMLTNSHPYYIQLLCLSMVESIVEDSKREIFSQQDLDKAVKHLLRSQGTFYQLLDALPEERVEVRVVLSCLARLASLTHRPVTFDSLVQHLGSKSSEDRVKQILDDLTEIEVLEQLESSNASYTIRLPLLQRWLEKNAP